MERVVSAKHTSCNSLQTGNHNQTGSTKSSLINGKKYMIVNDLPTTVFETLLKCYFFPETGTHNAKALLK